ncbi:MAG TPA: GvpL/GvpF family gas vesicle protein [Nocardioidaceae bacterium]|nr:GvpL/GvpF family gas vesicle protein [Nocardioidaceae bacterium]
MAERARYLYAITRNVDPSPLGSTPALSGGRLDVVEHRGLTAVVSDVDLREFGQEGLRENLERLEWLEKVARGHDTVVQAVASLGPTAPLRLATICLDDEGVRRRLDEWHDALHVVLDRVEGRMEWSVKAFADPVQAGVDTSGVPEPAQGGGAAYLQRKKSEQTAREHREADAARVAGEIHDALAASSSASRRLPAQDPQLTGHTGTMTLNGAYLVDLDEVAEFEATFHRLQKEHPDAALALQGPWPPYSFAVLEQ